MKKALGVIIGIIAVIWIGLKIFGRAESKTVLSSQVSFEVYLDDSLNLNEYFEFTSDTFDIEKHKILCLLPVEIQGFKPSSTSVKMDLSNIDCNANYEEQKYVKYEPYEIKGKDFTLIVANKNANLTVLESPEMLNSSIGRKLILAKKKLKYNYKKGKINRLVLSKNGLSEHCE